MCCCYMEKPRCVAMGTCVCVFKWKLVDTDLPGESDVPLVQLVANAFKVMQNAAQFGPLRLPAIFLFSAYLHIQTSRN